MKFINTVLINTLLLCLEGIKKPLYKIKKALGGSITIKYQLTKNPESVNLRGLKCTTKVVPGTGLEPVQSYDREILSLLCLPISPPGRILMEARVGIEPAYTELQSAA